MRGGIYAATAGMLNSFAELDSIANNLANANTVGYKKKIITSLKAIMKRK